MARTKQKFRKTPKGGASVMGKLQNDASTNHSENEGNDKSNEIENYKSMDTETHIKDPRSKVRMSSITSATSTISLGNKSEKSEDKNKKYHKKDKQKSQPHSVINQSIPQKAPIKPPVTLATNKQQPSSLPQVANANQGAYVNDRTIYIEGLPFGSNESEVRTFFGECGQIVSVRLPTWHDTGRLKGYGHIEFASSESVTQAFNLDGCDFLDTGRFVKVSHPKVPRALSGGSAGASTVAGGSSSTGVRPVGCKTVFVKNLPYEVTEEQIQQTFMVCGPIAMVRLATWGHTGSQKGFCYVDFKREDSAEIAVKKTGVLKLNGRPLFIDYDTGRIKGSYRPPNSTANKINDNND